MPHNTSREKSLSEKLRALSSVITEMGSHSELQVAPIFDKALEQGSRALGAESACLHLADDEHGVLRIVAGYSMHSSWTRQWKELPLSGDNLPAACYQQGKVISRPSDQLPGDMKSATCAPVRGLEVTVGVLCLLWPDQVSPRSDLDLEPFLATLADLVGIAIEHYGLVSEMIDNIGRIMKLKAEEESRNQQLDELNVRLQEANRKLVELSITDGLTTLYNHRYLHQRLEQEIHRAQRQGHPLTLLMADLDHFKRLNDSLGHQNGDEALRRFAQWMKQGVRETDLVGRYGGEEFAVLLVDCGMENGLKVAEHLRRTTEEKSQEPPFDALGGFTVSLGLAEWQPGMNLDAFINQADKALYRAKRGGRNQVAVASLP